MLAPKILHQGTSNLSIYCFAPLGFPSAAFVPKGLKDQPSVLLQLADEHGLSIIGVGYASDADTLVVSEELELLRQKYPAKVLFGHSMGSVVALFFWAHNLKHNSSSVTELWLSGMTPKVFNSQLKPPDCNEEFRRSLIQRWNASEIIWKHSDSKIDSWRRQLLAVAKIDKNLLAELDFLGNSVRFIFVSGSQDKEIVSSLDSWTEWCDAQLKSRNIKYETSTIVMGGMDHNLLLTAEYPELCTRLFKTLL